MSSVPPSEPAVAIPDEVVALLAEDAGAVAPPDEAATPARVIAVANQKGGVGKTTTAVNLAACLAELGQAVVLVDLDPQGNASTGLGIDTRSLDVSLYDVLMDEASLAECLVDTEIPGLRVAPSSLDLAGAEIELVSVFSRESRLRTALRAWASAADQQSTGSAAPSGSAGSGPPLILIDCPPSLGLLTVNGLVAATEVLIPIQCEYYALEGLGQLLRNVDLVRRSLNPELLVRAIALVMFDARTNLADQVVREVRTHFGDKVCRTVVPRSVRLSEAPSFGQPIITFDPSSRGATAYRELAKEVLDAGQA